MMEVLADPVPHPRTKRQYRTVEERRRIVEQTLVPGVSVATVASAQGVNANQVFAWRKLYRSGLLGSSKASSAGEAGVSDVRLLPVRVSAEIEHVHAHSVVVANNQDCHGDGWGGSIEVTLAQAQIRVTGQLDAAVLRVVLECVRG